jgi:hypothetical protein
MALLANSVPLSTVFEFGAPRSATYLSSTVATPKAVVCRHGVSDTRGCIGQPRSVLGSSRPSNPQLDEIHSPSLVNRAGLA